MAASHPNDRLKLPAQMHFFTEVTLPGLWGPEPAVRATRHRRSESNLFAQGGFRALLRVNNPPPWVSLEDFDRTERRAVGVCLATPVCRNCLAATVPFGKLEPRMRKFSLIYLFCHPSRSRSCPDGGFLAHLTRSLIRPNWTRKQNRNRIRSAIGPTWSHWKLYSRNGPLGNLNIEERSLPMNVIQGSRLTPVVALMIGTTLLGWSAAAAQADGRLDPQDQASLATLASSEESGDNHKPTFKERLIRQVGITAAVLFFPPGFPLTNPPPPTNDSGESGSTPPPPPTNDSGESGSTPPPPPPAPNTNSPPAISPPPPINPPAPTWNPPRGDPPGQPPPPPHNPPVATPEPATLVSGLLGLGLLSVYSLRLRKRKV
jgi:hypothetical protein